MTVRFLQVHRDHVPAEAAHHAAHGARARRRHVGERGAHVAALRHLRQGGAGRPVAQVSRPLPTLLPRTRLHLRKVSK